MLTPAWYRCRPAAETERSKPWPVPRILRNDRVRPMGGWRSRAARGIRFFWCTILLVPGASQALDCPSIPQQTQKDLQVEVRAAVDRIGSAQGAELEKLTRNTTRDLLGKLPQADRVYLEQMMYATYCSALRDDPALTESQKSARIRAYNLELKRALQGTQGSGQRGASAMDAARAELERIPLPYTPDAFVDSAGNGKLEAVKLFLMAGMDPNTKNKDGNTALMHAAGGGHAGIVNALLKAKANVNERNQGGYTALSWAASSDRRDVLAILLDHGADHDAINKAFMSAAGSGHAEVLRMLLRQGADKHLVNEALEDAAGSAIVNVSEADRSDVIRFLLEQGGDVNAKDDEGWTALLSAAREGRVLLVQTLLDAGAGINTKCTCSGWLGGGWTALMMAAREGGERKAMLDMLLARGADPGLANNDGKTALLIALEFRGGIDTIHALLDRGADPNARDNTGSTAVMRAAGERGDVELVRALLEKRADVNIRNNDGSTALMWAATRGYVDNMEALLDAGADINAKSIKGRTALMLAVRQGQIETVQALLRRGAKVNDEDANGKTTLNYAEEDLKEQARTDMIRILKKAGAK